MPNDSSAFSASLLAAVRQRFAHVDTCPFTGPRVFFENAGGALTLNSVVETSTRFAGIPDNQGRDNPASRELGRIIDQAKAETLTWMGADSGQIFVGESGTELLFRLISAAIGAQASGSGAVLGSSIEHPASRSAAKRWAKIFGLEYINVPHDAAKGLVTPDAYAKAVKPDVKVATIVHASPVSGMGMDVAGIAAAIRAKAPQALIIVDGIQHAAHGDIDLKAYDVDGYVISPYKCFSRHGYGLAWLSDRLSAVPHDALEGGPALKWELGTRDTGAYATMLDVLAYFRWLGGQADPQAQDARAQYQAAAQAIHAQEQALTQAMLYGTGNLQGLAHMPGVQIIGGADNPAREGLVTFALDSMPAQDVVAALNAQGIRTHTRKADYYSANALEPLGLDAAVRVSVCHYNSLEEVAQLLAVMATLSHNQQL